MRFSSFKLAIGISVLSVVGSMGSTAMAAGFTADSLNGPSLVYSESGGLTSLDPNGDYQSALDGQGNVELGGQTASSSVADFDNATVLTGSFADGTQATFSSLTRSDWFGTDGVTSYGENDLANQWFGGLLSDGGLGARLAQFNIMASAFSMPTYSEGDVFGAFTAMGGFQRFSDPNIDSVSQNGNDLNIELAGHMDAAYPVSQFAPELANFFRGIQISEVLRVDYDGATQYLYSFAGDASGVMSDDQTFSHTGTFKVTAEGSDEVADVPEPATALGLLLVGIAGLGSARKTLAA